MTLKTTQLIRCDRVHGDGKQCTVERTQEKIPYVEPMYHIVLEVTVLDAKGETQLVKQDIHACYWDLYYMLSDVHDQAKADVEGRKLEELAHTGQTPDEL